MTRAIFRVPSYLRFRRDARGVSRALPLLALLLVTVSILSARALGATGPGSRDLVSEPAPVTVEAVTPTGYRVRVPIGEAVVERARIYGFDLVEIQVPGGVVEPARGTPSLPVRTVLLRVPWGSTPTVRGGRAGTRSLGSVEPTPIPRLLSEPGVRLRTTPRELAEALAAPAYRALGGGSEAPAVARTALMAAGGARYVAVTLRPVVWEAATREARVAAEITLDVSWERPAEPVSGAGRFTFGSPGGSGGAARARERRAAALEPPKAVGPHYPPRAGSGAEAVSPAGRAAAAPAAVGPFRVDPSRPWVRLGVVRSGLYRLTAADLVAAGVTTGGLDPTTFRLFRANPGDLPESVDVDLGPDSLRECAIAVAGEEDHVLDAADALYFYATGSTGLGYDLRLGGGMEYEESERSGEESLWLTWGAGPTGAPPRRIAPRDAAPTTPGAPSLTAVTHRVHYETNQFQAYDLFQYGFRWERWFMRSISQGSRVAYPIALPGALPDGAASIRARMWGQGASKGTSDSDHVAKLLWNHAVVDMEGWNFSLPRDLDATGLRTNGSRDTVEIEVPVIFDPADTTRADLQYLAWFEVAYPRRLAAAADTLEFAAPDSLPAGRVRYVITGIMDTTAVWLLDRADPETPVRLQGGVWSGTSPAFTLTVEDSVGPGYRPRYSLVSTARAARPRTVALYAPLASAHTLDDLLETGNATDYLIVVPPAFLAAAESLAVERSARLHGIAAPRAAIATTDRVFAQFAAGLPSHVAIRNMLAYATRRWSGPPLYVCLLGDASEDPRNYSGFGVIDWLPTAADNFDSTLRLQYITDDFFALLDGPSDQLFDVAIGRLPARDAADALGFVRGKRRVFEQTADFDFWRARALLVADDAWKWSFDDQLDPVGVEHVSQMERKDAYHLPFPIRREKVYLNDYAFADSAKTSKPKAREAFIAAVNAGNWLVDFIGHGNEGTLADEQVFRTQDVGRLTNASRPSIFGFFSCMVGRFDDMTQDGLAELLLRIPNGGAAVSLASSNEAFGIESTRLNDSFVDQLFPLAAPVDAVPADSSRVDSLRTAGLAWANAKSEPVNLNIIARKYSYLGDPALVPPIPRGRGHWEKAPLDSFLRGDVAVIRGHALNGDGTPDTISSGTVLLEALGPPSLRIQISKSVIGTLVPVPYRLPGPLLYRGETTLDRGAFELRFVVPTDGRVIGRGGEIRALLSAAGGRGVGLAADSIRIAAGLSARVDATPPIIRLRYAPGDSSLAPGSLLTIELEDSSGIDLTRLDNAHSIFVIVDDRGTPIDITSTFRYEPSSFTRGTATLTIPQLSGGAHLIEVHASDAYRNVAVATFTIDVVAGAGPNAALNLTEVFNYPNPFPEDTFLHARLNRAARLHVQILTVAGRRVRDFALDGKAGENYIPWDGRDSRGEKVALGVYLLKLTAEDSGGSRVSAVARALRAE